MAVGEFGLEMTRFDSGQRGARHVILSGDGLGAPMILIGAKNLHLICDRAMKCRFRSLRSGQSVMSRAFGTPRNTKMGLAIPLLGKEGVKGWSVFPSQPPLSPLLN